MRVQYEGDMREIRALTEKALLAGNLCNVALLEALNIKTVLGST